jgi:hypothetical protein
VVTIETHPLQHIAVVYSDAAPDTRHYRLLVDLDSPSLAALALYQLGEELSIAAAQVEHPQSFRYQRFDQLII